MEVNEGDTFLYEFPETKKHLFIVITKILTVNNTVQYVCTMVSTWKPNSKLSDPACILEEGCHPFVNHKSYVAYKETVLFTDQLLTYLFGTGLAIKKEPFNKELLKEVKESAKKSKLISPMMKQYY